MPPMRHKATALSVLPVLLALRNACYLINELLIISVWGWEEQQMGNSKNHPGEHREHIEIMNKT